ncbi:MAG: sulfide/dihydroorotate dehydrogenase-like FAD/NAD-binding protein, partial [Bacillota bacterium]
GNQIITLVGAQSEEMIIMKDRLEAVSDEIYFSTDDGSLGHEGFVTDLLERELASEKEIDEVIAIGPVVMMEAACQVTAKYDVDTMVSLNPIMIDGTGMCGGCRVTVGDKKQFACIDGPAFDGHAVDFAELSRRQDHYEMKEEQVDHQCRLDQEVAADE